MHKKIISVIIGILLSVSIVLAASSYRVNANQVSLITEFSTPKNINNSGSYALFIPTNTVAEWQAFYNHAPQGVKALQCEWVSYTGYTSSPSYSCYPYYFAEARTEPCSGGINNIYYGADNAGWSCNSNHISLDPEWNGFVYTSTYQCRCPSSWLMRFLKSFN